MYVYIFIKKEIPESVGIAYIVYAILISGWGDF
jgi:hypothetical protein